MNIGGCRKINVECIENNLCRIMFEIILRPSHENKASVRALFGDGTVLRGNVHLVRSLLVVAAPGSAWQHFALSRAVERADASGVASLARSLRLSRMTRLSIVSAKSQVSCFRG